MAASGKLIGITSFLKGEYHGRRLEYQELKFEENWVNGKRQGPQKTFDAKGFMTVTVYRGDRPLSK